MSLKTLKPKNHKIGAAIIRKELRTCIRLSDDRACEATVNHSDPKKNAPEFPSIVQELSKYSCACFRVTWIRVWRSGFFM